MIVTILLVRLLALLAAIALFPFVIFERLTYKRRTVPRVLFGATSIFVLPQLAAALKERGIPAFAGAVADVDFAVPEGFDRVVWASSSHNSFVRNVVGGLEALGAFLWALRRADVFTLYLDGGFLRRTPLQLWEPWLLKLAKKQVIFFPYGSDAWSLERTPDPVLRAGLAKDYPQLVVHSRAIARRLDAFCAEADLVVGCLVHNMTLPRTDALMLTCYGVETDRLKAQPLDLAAPVLRVFHAPNHRHCKGSNALEQAVAELQREGVAIELDLVQRIPRAEVLQRMARAHVVVDQLLCGYGMTALEGMALGRIVISGENWAPTLEPFLAMEAFRSCPVHWASPASIADVLRSIAVGRAQWEDWGKAGRSFVEAHHSPAAMARTWSALYPRLGYDLEQAGGRGPGGP